MRPHASEIQLMQQNVARLTAKLAQLEATERSDRIAPELDPKSDKQFFKKDYPDDLRPKVRDHFDHPFPTVQDSGDFEKDYVKDENNDGGEWKAQSEYDRLRAKLGKEEADVAKAAAKEKEEGEELKVATEREAAAKTKASDTKQKADAARDAAAKAEKEAESLTGDAEETAAKAKGSADAAGGAVGEAAAKVEKEISDLEECKRQLAEAQAKLKELLERSADAQQKAEVTKAEDAKAQAQVDTAEQTEEAAEAALSQQEGEHAKAARTAKEKKDDLDKTEADLKKAAENLRKFRKDVDDDGGVYRSNAPIGPSALPLVAGLFAVCTLVLQW